MKPVRAILVLTAPLALSWVTLLAAMCMTTLWTCTVDYQIPIGQLWMPALFIIVVLSVVAAAVLAADLLIIRVVQSHARKYQSLSLLVLGGITATLPRLIWGLYESPGIDKVAPQVEFLPFAIPGAVFILVLRMVLAKGHGGIKY